MYPVENPDYGTNQGASDLTPAMVSFNYQLNTTQNHWEGSLNEGLFILGWLMGMSVGDFTH